MSNRQNINREEEFEYHHSMPVQLRFNDIDSLGHLNNSVYFPLFDLGKAKYFEAIKGEQINVETIDIVVANINCNFLAPIFFSEDILVETQVLSISNSSFKMQQRLVNSSTKEIKCVCTTIMVGFNKDKQCSAPISKDWINNLNKYEGRELRAVK